MGKIYGEYHITVGQAQIESQFTGWLSKRLFALCEEVVNRSERNSLKGGLKQLITGSKLEVNEKNLPQHIEDNRVNMVFLSNATVPLELDAGDRRYLVLYGGKVPDSAYFNALSKEIKYGGIASFYWYLMQVDLTGFDQHTKPPMNEDKARLIEASMPNPAMFYKEWSAGELDVEYSSCHRSDLFVLYKRWCTRQNERAYTTRHFTPEIRRFMQDLTKDISYPDAKQRRKTQNLWIAPVDIELINQPNGILKLQNKVNAFRAALAKGEEQ